MDKLVIPLSLDADVVIGLLLLASTQIAVSDLTTL